MIASAIFSLLGAYWPLFTFCCRAFTTPTRTSGTLSRLALSVCTSPWVLEMLTVSSPPVAELEPEAPEVPWDCAPDFRELLTESVWISPGNWTLGSIFMAELLNSPRANMAPYWQLQVLSAKANEALTLIMPTVLGPFVNGSQDKYRLEALKLYREWRQHSHCGNEPRSVLSTLQPASRGRGLRPFLPRWTSLECPCRPRSHERDRRSHPRQRWISWTSKDRIEA